jgi:hypothetical protein
MTMRGPAQYYCEGCLKCDSCKEVVQLEATQESECGVLCSTCSEQSEGKSTCPLCRARETEEERLSRAWLRCEGCEEWLHQDCDQHARQAQAAGHYSCPGCRQQTIRGYYKEAIGWLSLLDQHGIFTNNDLDKSRSTSKEPMNFSLMERRVEAGGYDSRPVAGIMDDLRLMVRNATECSLCQERTHFEARKILALADPIQAFLEDRLNSINE